MSGIRLTDTYVYQFFVGWVVLFGLGAGMVSHARPEALSAFGYAITRLWFLAGIAGLIALASYVVGGWVLAFGRRLASWVSNVQAGG